MPVINATFIEAFTIDGGRVSETKGRDLNPILEPKIFPFRTSHPSAACRQLIMSIMCRIYVIPLLVTLVAVDYISPPPMMVIE